MEYTKQGYLNSDFKLFHITDQQKKEFEFHYHDFDKLMIFLRGNVSYSIEGKTYPLKPYDIVLVKHGELHRPVIHDQTPYERIIVYISPGFLQDYKTETYDLGNCFIKSAVEHTSVFRLHAMENHPLFRAIKKFEASFQSQAYAAELEQKLLFLEFMIQLNRATLQHGLDYMHNEVSNPKVLQIIQYIQEHLTSDISIDDIAKETFLSRYYMMRLFKTETGYTIHKYITQKRLQLAKIMLADHIPVTQVCYDCGFKDYTSFLSAYKKQFQELPKSEFTK